MSSVAAAGPAKAGRPNSETILNATPTITSTMVKCTICGWSAAIYLVAHYRKKGP